MEGVEGSDYINANYVLVSATVSLCVGISLCIGISLCVGIYTIVSIV